MKVRFYRSPRMMFALIAMSAFALVGAGLLIGEWMRLNPCPLCIFQRVLYISIGAWGLCGFVLPGQRRFWGGLILLTALGGVATASYQTWMQLYPEAVTVQCGAGEMNLIEQLVDWLGMQWPFMFMATGFCTSKEYILGLTMANWSIVCFSAYLLAALWTSFARVGPRYRFR